MRYHKKENVTDGFLAIVLSLAIHGLLLLGAYYLPVYRGSRSSGVPYRVEPYRVEIDLQAFRKALSQPTRNHSTDQVANPVPATTPRSDMKPTDSGSAAAKLLPEAPTQTSEPKETEQKDVAQESELQQEQPAMDDRGLYKVSEKKATGASLELVGWTWDSVPHPLDNTNEVGRIVFEVTIDDVGEIIAIKTLEKTVSPLVEQLYKDEVAKLTFNKTNMNMAHAPTSVGKITFILQYK